MPDNTLNTLDFTRHLSAYKLRRYKSLNKFANKGRTVFAGSSFIEDFPISELAMDVGIPYPIYNRGISGYTTNQLLSALDTCVIELAPSRLFINIGAEDLDAEGDVVSHMISNYCLLLASILDALPMCEVNIMSLPPVAEFLRDTSPFQTYLRTMDRIRTTNYALSVLARDLGVNYVDAMTPLYDRHGYLHVEYAADHTHLWPTGYKMVLSELSKYL